MASRWYYRILNEEFGPVSFETIGELAAGGDLSPEDKLRCGDDGEWMSAADVVGLFPDQADAAAPDDSGVISDFSELNFELAGSNDGVPSARAKPRAGVDLPDFELQPAPAATESTQAGAQTHSDADAPLSSDTVDEHRPAREVSPKTQTSARKGAAEQRRRKKKQSAQIADDEIADWLSDGSEPADVADPPHDRPSRSPAGPAEQPASPPKPRGLATGDKPEASESRGNALVEAATAAAAPRPAKPRRSLSLPSISLPKIRIGAKPLAITAGVVLIGGLAAWILLSPSVHPAKQHFEALSKIHTEFKNLRARGASETEFATFAQQAEQQNQQIAAALQAAKTTTGDDAQGWALLVEASAALKPMLEDARDEESESEAKFVETLKQAAREFDYFR